MEKILFIVPPHMTYEKFTKPSFNESTNAKKSGIYGSLLTDMPLGVLSLSAYVKKYTDIETKLIDFNILLNKMDDFKFNSFLEVFNTYLTKNELVDYSPTIIGISVLFTPSYQSMLDLGNVCRKIFPNAVIIAGGSIPTNMPNEIYKNTNAFDALCYGEGEKPLLELVQADNKLKYLEGDPSWITQKKVENNEKYQHNFIEDLDEIPFSDYGILDTDEYGFNPAMRAYASIENKEQNFHVMTSRGCTHHCCFCASHKVHGRKMRYYSISRVKEDFLRLKNEYGAKVLIFQDDHLMRDKKRALEIINIVKNELELNVVFQNALAMYALDRKTLEFIRNAGIEQISMSIESGSEKVLKEIMHKPLSHSIIKRVINDCRDLGIYTNASILVGLPGETKQDLEDSRAFLKTVPANWFIILCATPLVGSEMFEICEKNKYFKGNYIGCDFKNAIVETEDFTAEYIQEIAYSFNLDLNFVNNSDFKLGNYENALKGFENAIRVKNDHAIAYYFAAKCCKKLNLNKKYIKYKEKYEKIIEKSTFWKKYFDEFNLSSLEQKQLITN
ncbi:MAG: radical SAM protein [Candidatus Gastranaerophilaceae bacterium]